MFQPMARGGDISRKLLETGIYYSKSADGSMVSVTVGKTDLTPNVYYVTSAMPSNLRPLHYHYYNITNGGGDKTKPVFCYITTTGEIHIASTTTDAYGTFTYPLEKVEL